MITFCFSFQMTQALTEDSQGRLLSGDIPPPLLQEIHSADLVQEILAWAGVSQLVGLAMEV